VDDLLNLAQRKRAARIAELNDALRRTFVGGKVMLTAGVDGLPNELKAQVLQMVREFSYFDSCNDPHGEHDFGAFEISSAKIFWKIDYYDPDLHFGSEDPADPEKTTRVLTIMLANEY
jgi:hypothetical protein